MLKCHFCPPKVALSEGKSAAFRVQKWLFGVVKTSDLMVYMSYFGIINIAHVCPYLSIVLTFSTIRLHTKY